MLHGWVKILIQGKEICTFLPTVDVCEVEIGVVFLAQKAVPALSVHDMIAIKVAIYKWALIS